MRHDTIASRLAALVLAALGAVAFPASAATGDVLQSRTISFSSDSPVNDMAEGAALLPGGGVVMVGEGQADASTPWDFAAAVLAPDFSLDPAFNGNGKGLYPIDRIDQGSDSAQAVARQPDGKLVLCGNAQSTQSGSVLGDAFVLLRVNADGSVDTGFGDHGVVLADPISGYTTSIASCNGLALSADGKILAVGWADHFGAHGLVAVRLLPDGSLDTSFGSDGRVFYRAMDASLGDAVSNAVVVDVGGRSYITGVVHRFANPETEAYLVMRLLPDGALDTSYNGSGYLVVPFGVFDLGTSIHLLGDGSVYVGGNDNAPGPGHYLMSLLKVSPDGQLQTSFGSAGRAVADFPAQGPGYQESKSYGLAVQPDGRIVLAGYSLDATGEPQIALARFLPDGSLDPSFGNLQPGMSMYQLGAYSRAKAVVFNPVSGELNVVGSGEHNGNPAFLALRIDAGNTDLVFTDGFEGSTP